METILSRSKWTSTSARGAGFNWSRIRGIVAHYPAAGRDIGVLSQAQEASRLRGWRNYHVSGRGWADIGYNYGIGQSGRIYSLRGNRAGAHATGHNSTTVGVLFIVGDNEALTSAARASFKSLRAYLRKKGAGSGVWGHQQMSGASTRCPGPYIMGDIRSGRLSGGSSAAKPGGGGGGGGSTYKTVNKTAPLGLYDKDASNHSRIEDWQKNALGYSNKDADGYFGPDTDRDTRKLQKQIGVKADGLVGDDTMKAWEKAGKPKLAAPSESKGLFGMGMQSSMTRNKDIKLPKRKWKTVPVDDKNNTSIVSGLKPGDGALINAHFDLNGVPKGANVQVRFYTVSYKKGTKTRRLWTHYMTEFVGTDGITYALVPFLRRNGSKAASGRSIRIRCEIRVFQDNITLRRAQFNRAKS